MFKLNLQNFKLFENSELILKPLTILSGVNSSGKSSVIQSLLFAKQTLEMSKAARQKNGIISINNAQFNLDFNNSSELIFAGADKNKIQITIENESTHRKASFNYQVDSINNPLGVSFKIKDNLRTSPFHEKEFYYLNTIRITPRNFYHNQYLNYSHVGINGEYTSQILSENENMDVDSLRFFSDTEISTLGKQVEFWLNYISPGTQIRYEKLDKATLSTFKFKKRFSESDFLSPLNYGFGVTYSLPIIVNGLMAQKNRVFIVENPETHLHPLAQSRIGEFLAQISHSGVFVILETHSEHVLNGVRLYALKNSLPTDDISIIFFQTSEHGRALYKHIDVLNSGDLTEWPIDFFDQSSKDLLELIKLRRSYERNRS